MTADRSIILSVYVSFCHILVYPSNKSRYSPPYIRRLILIPCNVTNNNLSAFSVAKVEAPLISGTLFVEYPIENSPRPAEVFSQPVVDDMSSDIVRFNFANGEFFIEYFISNSIVSITVQGEQIPIPFGNGTLEMTKVEKIWGSSPSHNGKRYDAYDVTPTFVFKHPRGLSQELPTGYYRVAEPQP